MAVSRKTVTILFADVVDSTGLGERLDPELVRGVLSRWFEEARAIVERHGGTVEKFIGDAVMAVFGIPQTHEDDALRAVRAADELREALDRLNDEIDRERGFRLAVRVGVNSGEVVTGDGGGTLVTGDAVNVAKRLEEAARNGEVLVGELTQTLAKASATFEPVGPLEAKGKSGPVPAWRLWTVDRRGRPFERRFDTPLVGRRDELAELRRAYAYAVAEGGCHVFTLLGVAGIGKSRLASEFFRETAAEATIFVGHCLPYGDGITFWPVTEILREAGGDDALTGFLSPDEGELVLERLRGVTGRERVGTQEMFWAVRKVCEALARRKPLVICFEDVHWAEPTFVDLIQYLAGFVRDAPMLLLCIARPEFLDERPAWLSGREGAAALTLTPLSDVDSDALLDVLDTPVGTRPRIAAAAEGNPLYVEQMAAMLAEGGDIGSIPPTIHGLLVARLDRLPDGERSTIERAAVAGREFWGEAIVELTPEAEHADVGSNLLSLMRKDLIRPHRSTARPDDAFRFAHVLIRDAAYAGIPKERRANLHRRFADWASTNAAVPLAEMDEILGYHYEQAFRYRKQLGPIDDDAEALGRRAGELLAAAGRRALRRDDPPAAVKLLERAAALLDEPGAVAVLPDLGVALTAIGELARATEVLDDALARARSLGDRRLEASASIERAIVRAHAAAETRDIGRIAEEAIPVFAADNDGLVRAWRLIAIERFLRCEFGAMDRALQQAIHHARLAGNAREERSALRARALAVLLGPTPVIDAIHVCEEIRELTAATPSLHAVAAGPLAELLAMRGEFDEARRLCMEAKAVLAEHGRTLGLAGIALHAAPVELFAGCPAAAESELQSAHELLQHVDERGALSTVSAYLAVALAVQRRAAEAEDFADESRATASSADVFTQVVWRMGLARALAATGTTDRATEMARESVDLARGTDSPNLLADALVSLAEAVGGPSADEALDEAARLYEAKGNVISAARARGRLQPVGRGDRG